MKKIFDIFSGKKMKPIEKQKIIVDHREKNSLVISELISLGLDLEFKQLKVADFLVQGVAIERKTISDFISSMINRRLLKQLEEIQQYENKLLVIEGLDEKELYQNMEDWNGEGMHPNAIRGFLLSILLQHKVPILFTKNCEDTARFILLLSKRQKRELSLNVKKKSLNKKEQLQFILEGIPGIGPKTAKKLLNKFKTIQNVFNASEEELREVLGEKTEITVELIHSKY